MTTEEQRAAVLRSELADELERNGDLRSPRWRQAVEAVPRHLFLPEFFREVGRSAPTLWEPVTPLSLGSDEWLRMVYANQTWVTQLDDGTRPGDVDGPVTGQPTSSSTLPGLVVSMLEALEVGDGMDVLEIGTGTGYSTALLCHRLGDEHVTTVETDPAVAAQADSALEALGSECTLITGDGLLGYPPGAPYDRIVATCAVRRIPYTWVRQTVSGGLILTTLSGWLLGSGLARLRVERDTAEGSFLPGCVSFMPARPHQPPPVTGSLDARTAFPDSQHPARYGPTILDDWMPRFVAQLAAPRAQALTASLDGGPPTTYLLDISSESFAALTPESDGTHTVRQGGPVALWDDIEDALAAWSEVGSPGIESFRLRVTSHRQTVWLDTPSRPSWDLPA